LRFNLPQPDVSIIRAAPQEQDFRERETAIKEGELALKKKEANRSLITGPLSLAVIGATIAALANVWVA
jgi:hypothetical protein